MIRVVVADDQPLVRAGLATVVGVAGDLELVGEAADGEAAVALAAEQRPHVVLMDVRMPGLDGIEATRRIVADSGNADVRVLMLTTFDLDEYVFGALRAGASGFLLKDTRPEQLIDAVRVVAAGEALLAPAVTRRLVEQFVRRASLGQPDATAVDVLTDREREVLALVGRGMSNTEIATALFLSPATAKTHVSNIMSKLGARDRAQLVVLAYESGLVVPGSG